MKKEKLVAKAKPAKKVKKTNFSTENFVDIENLTPLSNRPDYLNALRHAQKMPKKKLIASIEVFQTNKNIFEIAVKSTGKEKKGIKKYLENAVDTHNFINTLIDEESMNKIKGYIDEFEKQESIYKKNNTNKKK